MRRDNESPDCTCHSAFNITLGLFVKSGEFENLYKKPPMFIGLHQHAKRMGLGYLLYMLEWLNGNCTGGHISAIPIWWPLMLVGPMWAPWCKILFCRIHAF